MDPDYSCLCAVLLINCSFYNRDWKSFRFLSARLPVLFISTSYQEEETLLFDKDECLPNENISDIIGTVAYIEL